MLRKLFLVLGAWCALVPVLGDLTHASSTDIVLTAAHAVDIHGHWSRTADASASSGVMLASGDTGWQNTTAAVPAPMHYVDFTFTPQANVAYRVWLRLRASTGSKYNDSVFVQFSNARDSKNAARYRVGTTESLVINRQSCNGCTLTGWGWYDGAYWLTQPSVLKFAAGSQTLRIQTREDGVQIDQIVLSPVNFLTTAPGPKDSDTTILASPEQVASAALSGAAIALPGTIAADAFDEGPAGIAYHDMTTGNAGGGRATDVDLLALSTGEYAITGIDAGEWLNYTVHVPFAGEYVIEADVAAAVDGGRVHIDAQGKNLTGVLMIPNTGSATTLTTLAQAVTLPAGSYPLKVVFDAKLTNGSLAGLRISRPRSPFATAPHALPGVIPAYQFDNGGQGWSWLDHTPGNAGVPLRVTDVDLFGSQSGGYYVGSTADGEWLEYTVTVGASAEYIVRFEVASATDTAQVSARFGSVSTPILMVPNTGSGTTWSSVETIVSLQAGEQVMRVLVDRGGFSLRSISVEPAPTFTTFEVPAGGNLQAAIDAAVPGDVILLQAGATYVGNFTLPAKADGAADRWVTIRSSASDALLPGEGQRITPAFASLLPKLRSPNTQPALATKPYASHYRLQFLEFLANTNGSGNIISLGDATAAQNTLAVVPHHLILDRVYVHGDVVKGQKRGVALNSAHTTIVNSYISEIKAVGQDSQAIGGWNGPGPYVISNNYLEAAGENVMFGGADPAIPDLVPSDITFTRNHLFKPLSWRGSAWTIKNLFELKSAQRVLIDSNLMENNWLAAQTGYAVLLKSVNQDGAAPWSVVQDITFTNNVVRHVSSAINILGQDTRYPALVANNIVIRNNLFDDVSGAKYGGSGRLLQINGGTDIVVDHNTVMADGSTIVMADGLPTERFTFTNNVLPHNLYGIKGTGTAVGWGTITKYFPNGLFVGGLYIGGKASQYPTGNFFPATIADAGFIDFAQGDYRLSPLSVYLGAGSDGTNPGVNFAALAAAFAAAQ